MIRKGTGERKPGTINEMAGTDPDSRHSYPDQLRSLPAPGAIRLRLGSRGGLSTGDRALHDDAGNAGHSAMDMEWPYAGQRG